MIDTVLSNRHVFYVILTIAMQDAYPHIYRSENGKSADLIVHFYTVYK